MTYWKDRSYRWYAGRVPGVCRRRRRRSTGIVQPAASVADLPHEPLGHGLVGPVLGQEQRDQQPAGSGAGVGEVVGVYLHQIVAEAVDALCLRAALTGTNGRVEESTPADRSCERVHLLRKEAC
jgi:hypothetical protein